MARYILIVGTPADRSNFYHSILSLMTMSESNQQLPRDMSLKEAQDKKSICVMKGQEPILYIREHTPTSPDKKQYAAGIIHVMPAQASEKLADDLIDADELFKKYRVETEIFDQSEGDPIAALARLIEAIQQVDEMREQSSSEGKKAMSRTCRASLFGMFGASAVRVNLQDRLNAVANEIVSQAKKS